MTMDVISPTTEEKTVLKTKPTSASKTAKGKKTMSLGLDLGTLFSCYVNKLPKPDSDDSGATIIPSVVGYAEEGILSGILPGNNSTLFGDDALANELHLRLASSSLRRGGQRR